jgi:hypothetical protein
MRPSFGRDVTLQTDGLRVSFYGGGSYVLGYVSFGVPSKAYMRAVDWGLEYKKEFYSTRKGRRGAQSGWDAVAGVCNTRGSSHEDCGAW